MPVEYFLRYKELCYDVGTRLRFKIGHEIKEGEIEWISHNHIYLRLTDGTGWQLSKIWSLDNTIVEIVTPVYYQEPPQVHTRGGPPPSEGDFFVGLVWYIAIMLIGTIFKDRLMIWVVATTIFLLWKNGLLNGGKK